MSNTLSSAPEEGFGKGKNGWLEKFLTEKMNPNFFVGKLRFIICLPLSKPVIAGFFICALRRLPSCLCVKRMKVQ